MALRVGEGDRRGLVGGSMASLSEFVTVSPNAPQAQASPRARVTPAMLFQKSCNDSVPPGCAKP